MTYLEIYNHNPALFAYNTFVQFQHMADKVQRILEDVLQDSIYLVKKGVFTEGELKRQMASRQRSETNLVKKSIRATDYLKAIQYQYQLQRIRRYRQSEQSDVVIDPKYKRANTKDFTIIKRAIRLWDRTLHKYRFRIDLWKQYLLFCHTIKSKKAFYKALTNAVRFNPFELELWLAGVYYEFEVIKNPWNARLIFHKALKLNRSNIHFWKEYLRFECEFAELVLKRESALGEEAVMKIEGEERNQKLSQIDFKGLLKQVVEAAIEAVPTDSRQALVNNMSSVLSGYQNTILQATTQQAMSALENIVKQESTEENKIGNLLKINYKKNIEQLRSSFILKSNEEKLQVIKHFQPQQRKEFLGQIPFKKLDFKQKLVYFEAWSKLMIEDCALDADVVALAIKQLCFYPNQLSSFILSVVSLDPIAVFKKLMNYKLNVSSSIVTYYLMSYVDLKLSSFQMDQLLKRTNKDYKNKQFLRAWVRYNIRNNRFKDNLKLLQTLRVSGDQQVFQEISGLATSESSQ